jgi:hypothetical protein
LLPAGLARPAEKFCEFVRELLLAERVFIDDNDKLEVLVMEALRLLSLR